MLGYLAGGVTGAVALWYAVASAWAASVRTHNPDLREGAGQIRYGWRCPRCGRLEAPSCQVRKCGGPLVWVSRNTRIRCSRCHRGFVAHPMLFREAPRRRKMHCRQCGWSGRISHWRLD
jgi:transcription elongation factor Elf1